MQEFVNVLECWDTVGMLIDDVYALTCSRCSQQNGRSHEICVSESLICVSLRSDFSTIGFSNVKPHQLEAILAFCEGKDVCVSLPTGFGKTPIFAVPPSLFKTIRRSTTSVARLSVP